MICTCIWADKAGPTVIDPECHHARELADA
jgi:hypothetical protein